MTEKYILAFMEDINKIVYQIQFKTKVSENLPEIIKMIENLIKKILLMCQKEMYFLELINFLNIVNYQNKKQKILEVGFRIKKDENKENPLDFCFMEV